jgi:hypothetical protein
MRSKVDHTAFRGPKRTGLLLVFFLLLLSIMMMPYNAVAQYRGGREYQGQLYGQFCPGSHRGGPYGGRNPVSTVEQVTQAIEKCLSIRNQGLHTGRTLDNRGYFEVEVADRNGAIVDRLIVVKRNGRIRSIYETPTEKQHLRGVLAAIE